MEKGSCTIFAADVVAMLTATLRCHAARSISSKVAAGGPWTHVMELEKFPKSSAFMVKFRQLTSTRLRLCLPLLFYLLVLVYVDFSLSDFLISSLAISNVLLVCFVCHFMGFLQVGETSRWLM